MVNRKSKNAVCNNMKWSKQDDDLLYEMMQSGRTYSQIASALGRSLRSVENHAYQMRLERRRLGMDDSDLYANRPPRKKRIQKTQPVMKADPIQPEITGALFDKRIGDLLLYTAVFTGGCLLTLVVMTILLIAIS
jgi:hypothetical protein